MIKAYHLFCKVFIICLLGLFNGLMAHAQSVLQGVVVDASTGDPIEMATVQLLRGKNERLINYALTDVQGKFAIRTQQTDSLQLSVSLLGYKTEKEIVVQGKEIVFRLEQQAFSLKEVEIRPGRIYGVRDTINYDVSQFLSANDETIKDVIKKLPGVDVDELGRISYNGKDISNFYVEGMDLTDGRYAQIANNLDAKAVETVQLLENHQPIRILQDKIKTENIAMNLKLKPEFRDKWMVTLQAGAGLSPFLWDGWLNALQLNRKSQSAYVYRGNNRGYDVADENIRFFNQYSGKLQEPDASAFLSQPSIMAPLKKDRLLFNDIHSLTANRLYKLNETTQIRLNAGYSHDKRKQTRGSETYYFQQQDTAYVAEQSKSSILSDQAELSLNLENNASERFLTDKLNITGNWQRSNSFFTGNSVIDQQIKTQDIGIRNDFKSLFERGDYTYEVRSVLRYNHQPSSLLYNNVDQYINLNHFYTDNTFSVLWKKGYLTQQYSGGITGQMSNLQNGYSLYAYPSWQWNKDKWQTRFSLPLIWTKFPGGDLSRLSANPSLYVSYKWNYAWRFSVSANYKEQYGSVLDFYTVPYRTDYRHSVENEGNLPVYQLQNYSIYGEYKNTIHEFFATLSLNYSRNKSSHIYEQVIDKESVSLVSHKLSNHSENRQLRGTLSKGFYDWGIKTSLDYQYSNSKAEQLNEGVRIPYQSNRVQLDPKINWSASKRFEAGYEANLRWHKSKIGKETSLTPLWNIVQKLYASYNLFPFEVKISADHYYNEINENKSIDNFFADISFGWKHAGWQLTASITNLFDKQQYRYTEYSSIQSYTSWIDIRGRELLISARYKF